MLIPDEGGDGTVVAPFSIRGEETAGNFIHAMVICDTFAALSFARAGFIAATALFHAGFVFTVHLWLLGNASQAEFCEQGIDGVLLVTVAGGVRNAADTVDEAGIGLGDLVLEF